MINLTLAIPGLEYLKSTLPHLSLIAGRGEKLTGFANLYDFIAKSVGLESENQLPLAMGSALIEGLEVHEGFWLRADPVRLEASNRGVYCLGSQVLNLTREEAESLIHSLNIFLANDAIIFYLGERNTDWYIQVPESKDLSLTPLSTIVGKDLRAYLPKGHDAALLEGLLTEIQMLLYQHEVNVVRRENGLPTIDGLWVYGAGFAIDKWPWQLTLSADKALRGLAVLGGGKADLPPSSFGDIFTEQFASILVSYNRLDEALALSDMAKYQEALQALENDWLQPIWQALRDKKIAVLTLQLPGVSYRITSSDSYRFWRRPKRFLDILC